MAKAREQICTISHQDRQCRLHLDTPRESWAVLRVMNTGHGRESQHCTGTLPLPLGYTGDLLAPQAILDPSPACQTGKIPCQNTTSRYWNTRSEKGSGKGGGQTLHFNLGSSFLIVRQNSKSSYGKAAFIPQRNKSSALAEITEYLCTLPLPDFTWQLWRMHKQEQPMQQNMGNTETQLNKKINRM